MKQHLKQIRKNVDLYRDNKTGIAWVENGETGCVHSCHPNIDASGSVAGMKKLGYWDKNARCKKCDGYIYNIDLLVVNDELDEIAMQNCQCGGKH